MSNHTTPMTRRHFIGNTASTALLLMAGGHVLGQSQKAVVNEREFLFLEAEGFEDFGGWELDQQSMDQMGSPYLLAHGLGVPVPRRANIASGSARVIGLRPGKLRGLPANSNWWSTASRSLKFSEPRAQRGTGMMAV
jgi:hypothetical protein